MAKSITKKFMQKMDKHEINNVNDFIKAIIESSKVLPKYKSISEYQRALQGMINSTKFSNDKEYKNCLFENNNPLNPIRADIKKTYIDRISKNSIINEIDKDIRGVQRNEENEKHNQEDRLNYKNNLVALSKTFKNAFEYQYNIEKSRNFFQRLFYRIFGDPLKNKVNELRDELSKTELGGVYVSEIMVSKNSVENINNIVNRAMMENRATKENDTYKTVNPFTEATTALNIEDIELESDMFRGAEGINIEKTNEEEILNNDSFDFSREEIQVTPANINKVHVADIDANDVDIEMVNRVNEDYIGEIITKNSDDALEEQESMEI